MVRGRSCINGRKLYGYRIRVVNAVTLRKYEYVLFFSFVENKKNSSTKQLQNVTIKEKENAIFEYVVSHKNLPVTWFVNEVEVIPGPKYQILSSEFTHKLAMNLVKMEDNWSKVKVVFRTETSAAVLTVER